MAGTSNSIITHNVLKGTLNSDNVISGLVNTAFNPAYALVTQAGAQIVLFINNNDYKMYAQLKDKNGNLIYTSNIIDLPLETKVVDGRYDSNTKKLILVLDNGNEIKVPLEALINGLVNEDDLIANYYDKDEIDALLNGYWTKIELTQEDIDNWNAKQEYLNQGDGIEISADTILKGNTRQESTTGKNLLNIFNFEMGAMSNGSIMSSSYRINNVNNPIEVKPNTTYCISSVLSTQVKGMRCGIHECDENMTFKKDSDWQQLATNPYVFTTENYTKYVKIVFTLSTTSTNVQTNITEDVTSYNNAVDWARGCLFQLEEGNTATSWEKYTGGTPAPNPDYPYPVNVVTGDNEVKVEGKNLIPFTNQDFTLNNVRYYVQNGSLYINGTSTGETSSKNQNFTDNFSFTLPSGTYTISQNSTVGLYLFDSEGNNILSNPSYILSGTTRTITLENQMQLFFGFYVYQKSFANINAKVMIEKGSTATAYEPYQSQTYPINLGSMELCKIGDYQDYIYKNNGNWYKYGAIGKTEVNLTGNVGSLPNSNKYNAFVPTNKAQIYGNLCYCNKANYNQDNPQDGQFYQNAPNVVYVGNSTDTLATLKQKYDGSLLYYVLNTPTTTEITDTALISQLNALTTGFSNNWVENISQTNADLPFEIEYDNTNLTISASSNLVRNTDYANYSTAGVVKSNLSFETDNNGGAKCSIIEYSNYPSANNRNFISKGTLENVITGKGLTNKTYVDAADAVFESELFDDGVISIEDSTEANINNTMNKSQLKIDLKGNTYQESTTGKNLLNNTLTSQTKNGITCTVNNDKTVTLNGTATAATWFILNSSITLPAGTYTMSQGNTNGNVRMFCGALNGYTSNGVRTTTITEEKTSDISINVPNGTTVSNLVFKPMVEAGSTATDYEPYTNGSAPNPDYPQDVQVVTGDNTIKVEGKNLCNGITQNYYVNQVVTRCGYAVGDSGLIIEVDGVSDYTISSNTVQTRYRVGCLNEIPVEGGSNTIVYNGSKKDGTDDSVTINTNGYKYLVVNATDLTAIQIEKGSSASEFQPYRSQTYPIYLGVENLFDKDSPNIIPNKYLDTNGDLQNATKSSVSDYIKVLPSTIYSMQPFRSVSQRLCFYDSSKTFLSSVSLASINPNFTTPNNCEYIRTSFITNDIDIWQIEKGSKANHYIEYGTTPIELCKIGDYQDYIAKSTGKNLCPTQVSAWEQGNISESGNVESTTRLRTIDYYPIKNNTNYHISVQDTNYCFLNIRFYDSSKTYLEDYWTYDFTINGATDKTINIPSSTISNVAYMRVVLRRANSGTITASDITTIEPQIELGTTKTSFEPYGKVWYKYGAIGKITYTGASSENWTVWALGATNVERFYINTTDYMYLEYTKINQFKFDGSNDDKEHFRYSSFTLGGISYEKGELLIYINKDRLNSVDVAGFKSYLSNNNLIVYSILRTPTITEITDTTLIEQLDNLEKAYSYDTQTNISQTNNDMPFILDINAIANNVNGLKLENENQEYKTNKVIELSSNSTDDEYPSAKCVYDIVGNIEAVLAAMDSGSGV